MYFITTAWGPSLKANDGDLRAYARAEYGHADASWIYSIVSRTSTIRARRAKKPAVVGCLLPPAQFVTAASA